MTQQVTKFSDADFHSELRARYENMIYYITKSKAERISLQSKLREMDDEIAFAVEYKAKLHDLLFAMGFLKE